LKRRTARPGAGRRLSAPHCRSAALEFRLLDLAKRGQGIQNRIAPEASGESVCDPGSVDWLTSPCRAILYGPVIPPRLLGTMCCRRRSRAATGAPRFFIASGCLHFSEAAHLLLISAPKVRAVWGEWLPCWPEARPDAQRLRRKYRTSSED